MTPLLQATLACACGMVAGLLAPPAVILPLIALAGLLLRALLGKGRGGTALLALYLALGGAAGAVAGARARDGCAARWQPDQSVWLRGHITAAPVEGRSVGFQPAGPACSEPIRVLLPRATPTPAVGAPLLVRGSWQPFPTTTRWPVSAARLGTLRLAQVRPDTTVEVSRLAEWRASAQLSLRRLLPRRHGVAEALVLARTEALEPGLRDVFVASGMAHLLAISGAHVMVFAGAILLVLRLARLPLLAARIAALVLVAAYVAATGAPPAAARAALQFALVMAGLLLQRPAHAWTVMAGAALALLVAEPLNALDAGFQLSFAGVAGLLAYRRRLGQALPGGLPATLREGLATGLAATAATFPIAAIRFGQFAPIGLLATIVATPIVGLALPGTALLILLAPVAPPVAALLAPGVELLLGAFLATARAAAAVPGGHFAVAAPTMAALLVTAAAGIFWFAARRDADVRPANSPGEEQRIRRQRGLRVLQAAAAGGALLAWSPALSPGADHIELHVIDVGQGDAIAIRTPHGRWLLVDAGMRTARTDMGARRVVPYLLRAGARRLDVLLLTHPDADHLGGAASVLRAFAVDVVIDPGAPCGSDQYVETLKAVAAEPARWLAPAAGERLAVDGVELRFLHPATALLDVPEDPNDYSLVFRLGFGRFTALFMGDAPQAVERQLVAEHGRALDAAVLKVGHHGSRTSSSDELLDAASPGLAVVSVGRENRYGHPDAAVLARLVRHGARVLRTDRHGSMVIRAGRSGSIRLGASR